MSRNPDSRRLPPGGDNRANSSAFSAVALVVALMVGAIVAAFMLPIGIDALVEDSSTSVTQNQGETVNVTANLNSTLDDVDDTQNEINVTLRDSDSGETQTLQNIAEGSNKSTTINGETVTVANDNVSDATTADITYEYPPEYGWGSGAKSLWAILDVIIVLAMFLMFIAVALGASDDV